LLFILFSAAVHLGSDKNLTIDFVVSSHEDPSFTQGISFNNSLGPYTPLLLHESLHRPQKLYEGTTRDGGASKTIWYKHKRRKQLLHPCGPASIPVYVAAQSERGSPDLCHAWSAIWSDQPHLAGQHVQQHPGAPQPLRRLYGGPAQR